MVGTLSNKSRTAARKGTFFYSSLLLQISAVTHHISERKKCQGIQNRDGKSIDDTEKHRLHIEGPSSPGSVTWRAPKPVTSQSPTPAGSKLLLIGDGAMARGAL